MIFLFWPYKIPAFSTFHCLLSHKSLLVVQGNCNGLERVLHVRQHVISRYLCGNKVNALQCWYSHFHWLFGRPNKWYKRRQQCDNVRCHDISGFLKTKLEQIQRWELQHCIWKRHGLYQQWHKLQNTQWKPESILVQSQLTGGNSSIRIDLGTFFNRYAIAIKKFSFSSMITVNCHAQISLYGGAAHLPWRHWSFLRAWEAQKSWTFACTKTA